MFFLWSAIQKRLILWLAISCISIILFSSFLWIIHCLQLYAYGQHHSSTSIIFILRILLHSLLTTISLSTTVIGSYYYSFHLFNSATNRLNAFRFILRDNILAILSIFIGAQTYQNFLFSLIQLRSTEHISLIVSVVLLYSDKFYFQSMNYICWGNVVSILTHSSVSSTSKMTIAVSFKHLEVITIRCLITSLISVILNTFLKSYSSASFRLGSMGSNLSAWFVSFSLSLILCWLHTLFHFIVITHPMDYSILSICSNESLLVSALQIGLFPTLKTTIGISDKGTDFISTKGFSLSIFSKQAELAIISRSDVLNNLPMKVINTLPTHRDSLDWNHAIQLMNAFYQTLKQEVQSSCLVGFYISAPALLMGLSPTQQHWRALAFQDLHRLATAKTKQGKARRSNVFQDWMPSVVFSCCALIQAAVLQVIRIEVVVVVVVVRIIPIVWINFHF